MNEKLNPKDAELANLLQASAEDVNPSPAFIANLEDKLKVEHKPQTRWSLPNMRSLFAVVGWAGALAAMAFAMNWAVRTLAPIEPQPAAPDTPTPVEVTVEQVATPTGREFDWNGMKTYLTAPLPEAPADLSLYVYQSDQHATLESAQALAAQLGMNGQVYLVQPEMADRGENDYLIVDGNQRLQVRSDQYFAYYPDYTLQATSFNPVENPNAEQIIADFLTAKGFGIGYDIEAASFPGIYTARLLTPEGFPINFEYFSAAGLSFQFGPQGLYSVSANLAQYAPLNDKKYRIISAEEALQRLLDPTATGGFLAGQSSPYEPTQAWSRPRPQNETITIWGYMNSIPSATGGAPLVSLGGYTVIGNIKDFPEGQSNTFVEATGQVVFTNTDGTVFNVESWKVYEGYEDGIIGSLERDGDNVAIVSDQGRFILPDVPADVPVPMENIYAVGVKRGDVFEWSSLDTRTMFGGGGGGGGYGFYKLNLTGTPVPSSAFLPTPVPFIVNETGYPYTVVEGDTCESIASNFIVDVNSLIAVNNLPADCSNLQIGQTIVIPYTTPMPPQELNLRGILTITKFEQEDGSVLASYGFLTMGPSDDFDIFYYYILAGEGLEPLENYNGRPVDVWGTLGLNDDGVVTINVERYEIPFPDLQHEIWKGTEQVIESDGTSSLLFTDENGNSYVELGQNCYDPRPSDQTISTDPVNQVSAEVLAVPGLTSGGRPAICVIYAAPAVDPVTKQPIELTVTADHIEVLPQMSAANQATFLTIEIVELVYYTPNQRYLPLDPNQGPVYLQPAWHFYGHYNDGSVFEALIQALDPLFLLPELDLYMPPG